LIAPSVSLTFIHNIWLAQFSTSPLSKLLTPIPSTAKTGFQSFDDTSHSNEWWQSDINSDTF